MRVYIFFNQQSVARLRDQVFSETGLKTIVPSTTPGETEVVSLQAAQGQSEQ